MKAEAKREKVIELRKTGMTFQEIATEIGLKSDSWVAKICKENGLRGSELWKEKRYAEYRAYKAEGHTMAEVAEKFGINQATAQKVCKGIAKQIARPQEYKNQYTNGEFNREANAIKYIEERTPWFEYAGEFTGLDGYVNLKCKKCGAIIRKSFVTVKHGCAKCTECQKAETQRKAQEREAQRRKREAEADYRRWFRLSNLKAEQLSMQVCDACGELFFSARRGAKYCSIQCQRRITNALTKDKRLRRIAGALVDKDIDLQKLYERDEGVCAICGMVCDWDDYEVRDDTFIAGNSYPSIDHIVPLSRGGKHSWDNVQLACRLCNSKKWANV